MPRPSPRAPQGMPSRALNKSSSAPTEPADLQEGRARAWISKVGRAILRSISAAPEAQGREAAAQAALAQVLASPSPPPSVPEETAGAHEHETRDARSPPGNLESPAKASSQQHFGVQIVRPRVSPEYAHSSAASSLAAQQPERTAPPGEARSPHGTHPPARRTAFRRFLSDMFAKGSRSSGDSSAELELEDVSLQGSKPLDHADIPRAPSHDWQHQQPLLAERNSAPASSWQPGARVATAARAKPQYPRVSFAPLPENETKLLAVSPHLPAAMRRQQWRVEDYLDVEVLNGGYASEVFKATCR
eukprot:365542-Chlamydomonas_euryale.AAC.33